MIYAVVNTKGDVGETTTEVHLAIILSQNGKVLLLVGNPQASTTSLTT